MLKKLEQSQFSANWQLTLYTPWPVCFHQVHIFFSHGLCKITPLVNNFVYSRCICTIAKTTFKHLLQKCSLCCNPWQRTHQCHCWSMDSQANARTYGNLSIHSARKNERVRAESGVVPRRMQARCRPGWISTNVGGSPLWQYIGHGSKESKATASGARPSFGQEYGFQSEHVFFF